MTFEILRVFHCRADRQGDEDVRELVACACARACLAVWLSVCSGATIQFALLLFTYLNCFETNLHIYFMLAMKC